MKSKITFILLLMVAVLGKAQDIHLTQYYTNNIFLNPANTGNYHGDYRATLNYRNQWPQVINNPLFVTNAFSLEKKWSNFGHEFGAGVLMLNDQSGSKNNMINTNKIIVSGSYQKDIKDNLFRIGLQLGYVAKNNSNPNMTTHSMWDYSSGTYNTNFNNGENEINNKYNYLDLNGGIAWARLFSKTKITSGYAISHLNGPNDGFTSLYKKLSMLHTFHGSATFKLNKKLFLTPQLLYMNSGKASNFVVNLNAKQKLFTDFDVFVGAGFRGVSNPDALIGALGCTYKRFIVGYSMDFNSFEISEGAKNKSAYEFSIIYTTPSKSADKVTIPCDRY